MPGYDICLDMGISDLPQLEGVSVNSAPEGSSSTTTTTVRPIKTAKVSAKEGEKRKGGEGEEEEADRDIPSTPTGKEVRIPEKLPCPPAPKKRRLNGEEPKMHLGGGGCFVIIPPDHLEELFVRRVLQRIAK